MSADLHSRLARHGYEEAGCHCADVESQRARGNRPCDVVVQKGLSRAETVEGDGATVLTSTVKRPPNLGPSADASRSDLGPNRDHMDSRFRLVAVVRRGHVECRHLPIADLGTFLDGRPVLMTVDGSGAGIDDEDEPCASGCFRETKRSTEVPGLAAHAHLAHTPGIVSWRRLDNAAAPGGRAGGCLRNLRPRDHWAHPQSPELATLRVRGSALPHRTGLGVAHRR